MRLIDYLDKGASLGEAEPCMEMQGSVFSYGDVQRLSYRIANALRASGTRPGDKVAILSHNDPVAFSCVFGISRAGAVWCPINPRSEAAENRLILDAFDCTVLIFQRAFASLVEKIAPDLPKLRVLVCLDSKAAVVEPGGRTGAIADATATARANVTTAADPGGVAGEISFQRWLEDTSDAPVAVEPVDDLAMIAGTGGTTGKPKGVMLSGHNLEAMSAITLMSYPFRGRPVYLALAPLTHAAGVLCMPILTLGGCIQIMPSADLAAFLELIERRRVTHTFLPPTLIYMLLQHPALPRTDVSSLQCFWYGAAPIAAARLEEALLKIGPVMAQLFGQTEAPMMISTMSPAEHFATDGTIARERLTSAGRPTPLMQVRVMDDAGRLLPTGSRGEIVVRGPLVMSGYYKNAEATAEASRFGWHHTGDIGYLDADNFLFIVDRAKDMIITGGFNVYSVEVEQALLQHPDVQDSAVVGLPDEKWGERVTAVVQLHAGRGAQPDDIIAFVKERIGSVKSPKHVEIWADLPRSKVGKVLKNEIKAALLRGLEEAQQREP